MEKDITKESLDIKGVIIDGVEYITRPQAIQMAGVSLPTFKRKVKLFQIDFVQRSNRQLFKRKDIETAISNNWFSSMWV